MANKTGDPRGPGMPGSGGWFPTVENPAPETVILGPHNEVDLSFDSWQPSNAVLIQPDDLLVFQINASVAVSVNLAYVILRPDGTVLVTQETFTPTGVPPQLFSRRLTEGLLMSLTVTSAAFFPIDEFIYIAAAIQRPGVIGFQNANRIILCGYVTESYGISYPDTGFQGQWQDKGALTKYNGGTPAAGAEINYSQSLRRFRIQTLEATLTTSAAVATRSPQLIVTDGTNTTYQSPQGAGQAASLTWTYTWAQLPVAQLQFGTQQLIHYASDQGLGPGDHVQTVTQNLQAGDQWSLVRVSLEQWSNA